MSNDTHFEIIKVKEAKQNVDEFFSAQKELADCFYDLLQYIESLDSEIVFRYNEQIIGASKPNSVFHFYASYSDEKYYIKYKHVKQKIVFDPQLITAYKLYCQQIVKLINENPKYKLEPKEENTIDETTKPDFVPYFLMDCDIALNSCRKCFAEHEDYPITSGIFGERATNGMARHNIKTIGDLMNVDAARLYSIRNLGKKSISDITKGCYTLLSVFGGEIDPTTIEPNRDTGWEPLYIKTNRVIDKYVNMPVSLTETKEKETEFYISTESFIIECLNNGPFLTTREGKVLYMRHFEEKTLQEISDVFEVSRERIRQICQKSERKLIARIKKGIRYYPIISEFASLVETIDDAEYLQHMSFVNRENQFIWRCLLSLVTDKESKDTFQQIVDTYKKAIPEYERTMMGKMKTGNREQFGIEFNFIDYYYPKNKFRIKNRISNLVLNLKYGSEKDSKCAANEIKSILLPLFEENCNVCVVPASTINQSNKLIEVIKEIAPEKHINIIDCFQRIENKSSYATYGGIRDPENDKRTIKVVNTSQIRNKDIIVLDDICTSGSTFKACRDMLYENNVRTVKCLCLGSTIDMKEREKHLFALLSIPGMGRKTLFKILTDNPDIIDYYDCEATIDALRVYEKQYSRIKLPTVDEYKRYLDKAEMIIERHHNEGIETISFGSNNYPVALTQIDIPPILLYAKGNTKLLTAENYIAVIGSRSVSDHGAKVAKRLGCLFAQHGEIVVSGLAIGCDTNAHIGCLEANGKTIAILPSPIDNILPKNNIGLANEILNSGGLLVSEYYSGQEVKNSYYADRDRLQSGLSNGVVVVETSSDGGTMITVGKALKYGKIVGCYVHPARYQNNKELDGNRQLLSSNDVMHIDYADSIEEFIRRTHEVRETIKRALEKDNNEQLSFSI